MVAVDEPKSDVRAPVDIVGPVCESGDTFARQRDMPALQAGDLVAFRSAGAYGAVMSSTYNGRDLVPEILVNGAAYAVVAERYTIDDMIKRQRIPDWLDNATPKEATG